MIAQRVTAVNKQKKSFLINHAAGYIFLFKNLPGRAQYTAIEADN
jgi:hypothetical protein